MTDKLRDKIKNIPELPGIYKMLDGRGNIIYIGKSKCLKKRVKSYFTGTPKSEKVKKMVGLIRDIEYLVTDTHLEARLLECELIKSILPVFNSQMKRDRGYVYLKVEEYNPYHSLSVIRERDGDSYGPFRSGYSLQDFTRLMENLYPLQYVEGKFKFEYHIAPMKLERDLFQKNREVLIKLLSDEKYITLFLEELEAKMKKAASEFHYETAIRYRDLIAGMRMVQFGINGYNNLTTRTILLKLPTPSGVKLFYIVKGFIVHRKLYKAVTDQNIEDFLREARSCDPTPSPAMDEKTAIDFRDILCSEILSLPEDMVQIL